MNRKNKGERKIKEINQGKENQGPKQYVLIDSIKVSIDSIKVSTIVVKGSKTCIIFYFNQERLLLS